MGKLLGLVILVLDILAIIEIFKSKLDNGKKVLWTLLIVLLPLVGLIIYFLVGRKSIQS